MERWEGNHSYIKEYRDKMTHRNSPNITTLSSYAIELRPPAIFALKRATEDYLQATEFIKIILGNIAESFADFELFPGIKEQDNA